MSRSGNVVEVVWARGRNISRVHLRRSEDVWRTLCGRRISGRIVPARGTGDCQRCWRAR